MRKITDGYPTQKTGQQGDSEHLYLLEQVGNLYTLGVSLAMPKTFEQIPYPVPLSTSMLNSLLDWDHSADWPIETEPIFHVFARYHIDLHNSKKEVKLLKEELIVIKMNLFELPCVEMLGTIAETTPLQNNTHFV